MGSQRDSKQIDKGHPFAIRLLSVTYPMACRGVVFGGGIAPDLTAPGVTPDLTVPPRIFTAPPKKKTSKKELDQESDQVN